MIIWICGLSGSGKSSTARALSAILDSHNKPNIMLDGNHLRKIYDEKGYDRASRIALGIKYANLASALSDEKIVIIAANGMLNETSEYCRTHLSDFIEVFLDVPREELFRRDSAGLYSRYQNGEVRNVGGLDLIVDTPKADLHIKYNPKNSAKDIAEAIFDFLEHRDSPAQAQSAESNAILSTKARSLKNLQSRIKKGVILPIFTITRGEFSDKKALQNLLNNLKESGEKSFIVRSSSQNEDTLISSNAGAFLSIADVEVERIESAIEEVLKSYNDVNSSLGNHCIDLAFRHKARTPSPLTLCQNTKNSTSKTADTRILGEMQGDSMESAVDSAESSDSTYSNPLNDEVLIQPMAKNIAISGVAFNYEPKNFAPYYIIEYAKDSTDAVTSGVSGIKKYIHSRLCKTPPKDKFLIKVIALFKEIECLIPHTPLDMEFGIDKDGTIYLFQIRKLIIKSNAKELDSSTFEMLENKLASILKPQPFLYGKSGILSVMSDWNPAEIIGLHPRILSFSLYKELISDSIWADSRALLGYRNVAPNPLIYNLQGFPYVDVRASFNSFIPQSLDDKIARKLVDYYLDKLRSFPHLHDKVEFEIIFCGYYFDSDERLRELQNSGFSTDEISAIRLSLQSLMRDILAKKPYLEAIENIKILSQRREVALRLENKSEAIFWLLEDCKVYGTKSFAILARMGFMAVRFLDSLIQKGILNKEQKDSFINSLDGLTTQFSYDVANLKKDAFLAKYGHLRPGSYDILSPSYSENYEQYFSHTPSTSHAKRADSKRPKKADAKKVSEFNLSLNQIKEIESLLKDSGFNASVLEFFDFIAMGILEREKSKFEFSKNLSEILRLIGEVGADFGLNKNDLSFCEIGVFIKAFSASLHIEGLILESIARNKAEFLKQDGLLMPSIISNPNDIYSFYEMDSMPNFITQKRIKAEVLRLDSKTQDLSGKIICLQQADPGFDWIFSHNIAGLLTRFGGANSHMAIRANELGLPAVIGCGEKYDMWAGANVLEIDCANSKVEVVL